MTPSRDALARGQPFRLLSGGVGIVGELIGSGGQGSVYAVDTAGRRLALKWYHAHVALADVTLRARIARMVRQGPPDQSFLWPLDFAEIEGSPSFGYVMPLISGDRRPLKDMFVAPPRGINPSLEIRATSCFDIATSFQRLHATGYCYQDINFGGFFIDAERGTIQICDADNIAVDGEPGGVYGTRKFMAPEVVRREALPSTKTDLYSMAVLFFYMIFNWHPLDGKREAQAGVMDQALEMKLYGQDPCFLLDPHSDANGPVPKVHDWVVARWAAMTERMRTLFIRVFTQGLTRVQDRPLESEWRSALVHLRESTVNCPACGFAHGVDRVMQQRGLSCVACGAALPLPPLLNFGRDPVLLTPRRNIFEYQMSSGYVVTDAAPLGTVESHPRDIKILGLHNVGADTWSAHTLDGNKVTIVPGKTVRIVDGIAINFGFREGTVSGVAGGGAASLGSAA
jgi:eukaryotic-like serine/threonine-protein kinase